MSNWIWSQPVGEGAFSLGLVGDTNVQNRRDPASAFGNVMGALRDIDVMIGHLECPLCTPSDDPLAPDISFKDRWRHSDPAMVDGFAAAGFKAMTIASNVAYPPSAVVETVRHLDGAGIAHAGGGRDIAEARAPAIVEHVGMRIALLSYTSVFWPIEQPATERSAGVATIKAHTAYQPGRRVLEMPGAPPDIQTWADRDELDAMVDDVRRARRKADIVIVGCHWGVSSQEEHVAYQREIGQAAIDAGASLVFGAHPHRISGIEVYKGAPIFYSLGNFAFDWEKMAGRNLDGLLVRCIVAGGAITGIGFVPVRRDADNNIAIVDPGSAEGAGMVARIAELSAGLGGRFETRDGEVVLHLDDKAAVA